jgi:hypothetical protein
MIVSWASLLLSKSVDNLGDNGLAPERRILEVIGEGLIKGKVGTIDPLRVTR